MDLDSVRYRKMTAIYSLRFENKTDRTFFRKIPVRLSYAGRKTNRQFKIRTLFPNPVSEKGCMPPAGTNEIVLKEKEMRLLIKIKG